MELTDMLEECNVRQEREEEETEETISEAPEGEVTPFESLSSLATPGEQSFVMENAMPCCHICTYRFPLFETTTCSIDGCGIVVCNRHPDGVLELYSSFYVCCVCMNMCLCRPCNRRRRQMRARPLRTEISDARLVRKIQKANAHGLRHESDAAGLQHEPEGGNESEQESAPKKRRRSSPSRVYVFDDAAEKMGDIEASVAMCDNRSNVNCTLIKKLGDRVDASEKLLKNALADPSEEVDTRMKKISADGAETYAKVLLCDSKCQINIAGVKNLFSKMARCETRVAEMTDPSTGIVAKVNEHTITTVGDMMARLVAIEAYLGRLFSDKFVH